MDLVIVTGMSGSGKNTAIKILEDFGFFCVDNLPVRLLDKFADLALESPEGMQRVAIGIDVRGGQHLDEALEAIDHLKGRVSHFSLLFMDANEDCLLRRYKESRRVHPLADLTHSLEEAFSVERDLLAGLREAADVVIDTSFLLTRDLQTRLNEIYIQNTSYKSLNVTIMTFGYKYGIPEESDYVVDARILPNPYYDEKLRDLSGLDEPVRDYALGNPAGQEFLRLLKELFGFILKEAENGGRNSVVIAVGCTGGHHRSVTLARALADRLDRSKYNIVVSHRDIDH